jgi:hypothetical protein
VLNVTFTAEAHRKRDFRPNAIFDRRTCRLPVP